MFGVSEKTIRDIWVGRTWKAETRHLDPFRLVEVHHAEARRPLTESLNAGFQDKGSLDFAVFALVGIESDWPSPNQSIDDLLFDWEQAGSISRM
jgi:hypothetical protein